MAQNVDDILAELRARASRSLDEQKNAEHPSETSAALPAAEPEPEITLPQRSSPVREEPVAPRPKKAEPELEKDIDELYVASFVSEMPREDRAMKRRGTANRKAMVDRTSGKQKSFFAAVFEFIGFLLLVLLTILAVLILLQFIADVEIIPVEALWNDARTWILSLFG